MKRKELKVGSKYRAKVSGKIVTVQLDAISKRGSRGFAYDVTNLSTNRHTTFHSAQKFREEVLNGDGGTAQTVDPVASTTEGARPRVEEQTDVSQDKGGTVSEDSPTDGPSPRRDRRASLADKLHQRKQVTDTAPHLIVEARAGTGKTTTLVEGLTYAMGTQGSKNITPSPQQAAVWEQLRLSQGKAHTFCFVAFNKSIATELQRRVPQGCDAMTMHSMGFKAVCRAFGLHGRDVVTKWRVQDIISEITGKDIRELRRHHPNLLKATEKLVGLCKLNLVGTDIHSSPGDWFGDGSWEDALSSLAAHYDVDLNGDRQRVFDLVPQVLERCKDVARDGCMDFNDMIWLPVALGLNVYRYDLLLVDEAQDLNRCQQALAMKAGRRLILCGDPKQAIYGFAGADAESMPRMEDTLTATDRGCVTLPLTVTRRCGKAIVEEAKKIVPDFEAFETNGEGKVSYMTLK